jgi:hypothetical protein
MVQRQRWRNDRDGAAVVVKCGWWVVTRRRDGVSGSHTHRRWFQVGRRLKITAVVDGSWSRTRHHQVALRQKRGTWPKLIPEA